MNSPAILTTQENSILTITFNKPEALNALDEDMGRDFLKIMTKLKKQKDVRVVILTGAGRAFSSGGNLDMLTAKTKKTAAINQKELKKFYSLFLSLRDIPQPVIAAINGPAVGAGFCLALACDFRYASTEAKLGANFARLGLAPGMGGTFLVTRLAGCTRASEILMLGDILTAEKSLHYGLLNDIFQPSELMDRVQQIAKQLSQNAPISLGMIKKGIQKALTGSLTQLFDYDSKSQAACFKAKDILEGIASIREKRKPNFKGI